MTFSFPKKKKKEKETEQGDIFHSFPWRKTSF